MTQICVAAAPLLGAVGAAMGQSDLWTNGPYVTDPGAGAGGAAVSVVQASLMCQVFGFSCQGTPAFNRLTDDFTVPAGTDWTVTSIVFHQFQAGSTTTTPTFTSLNLRIWSGQPGGGGATVLFGDTSTNRLGSAAWTGSYRCMEGDLTGTTRPIFSVEAVINPPLHLSAGTYWVDWQSSGSLSFGPFCVPVTILGQPGAPGANARGFTGPSGPWGNLRDTGNQVQQEMAFVVRGSTGGAPPCYANCDGSTVPPTLNVQDFSCFLNRFAAGDSRANCDGSTVPPTLNVQDFSCFLNRFASGCSAP